MKGTGKELRGDSMAQIVAMYLMTSPHSSMIGIFYQPKLYIAQETGTPLEGASKALQRLIQVGFCDYDEASETVFVIRMAAFQVADSLKHGDNRVTGIKRDLEKIVSTRLKQRFLEVYGRAFHLVPDDWTPSPFEAPCKPLRSQEQEQEQEQAHEQEQARDHFLKGSGETLLTSTNGNGHGGTKDRTVSRPTPKEIREGNRMKIETAIKACPNYSSKEIADKVLAGSGIAPMQVENFRTRSY
jgi:hypothetical protein